MNQPFILKFSSITNLSDARFAAGVWADFVGFCFDPSSVDYLEPAKANEITSWINGPLIVGEFHHQPVEWILDFIKATGLHAVQIPANYPYPDIFNTPNIKFILETSNAEENEHFKHADLILCHSILVYDHLKASSNIPILLQTDDLKINAPMYEGIALKGAAEDKPGTRNQIEWREFLELWEIE